MKGLAEGQYIKHFRYGCGVIRETDGDRTTIDFDPHRSPRRNKAVPALTVAKKEPSAK